MPPEYVADAIVGTIGEGSELEHFIHALAQIASPRRP